MTTRSAYESRGYFGPFACAESAGLGRIVQALETERYGALLNRHLELGAVSEVCRHAALAEHCRAILGPDLMIWRTMFFHGVPKLSWHRDLYSEFLHSPAGAAPQVSVHLAITPATRENCMVVIPGSHRLSDEEVSRKYSFKKVDPHVKGNCRFEGGAVADAERLLLKPGEAIIFHPMLLHASSATLDGAGQAAPKRLALAVRVTVPAVRVDESAFPANARGKSGCVMLCGTGASSPNRLAAFAGLQAERKAS